MLLDPRALLMLAVLVGVTGWVLKGLMVTWHRLNKGPEASSSKLDEMEERIRKIEAATTSLLVDVTSIREKQRFMAKLQSGSEARTAPPPAMGSSEGDISPMVIQSIPIMPRAGNR